MNWEELDAKLREGVEQECEAQQRKSTHRGIEQSLIKMLPSEFEVPETLIEQAQQQTEPAIEPGGVAPAAALPQQKSALPSRSDMSLIRIAARGGRLDCVRSWHT